MPNSVREWLEEDETRDLGSGARAAKLAELNERREKLKENLSAIKREASDGDRETVLRDKKEEVEKILSAWQSLDTEVSIEERLERAEKLESEQRANGKKATAAFIEKVGREQDERIAQGLDVEIRRAEEHRNVMGEFSSSQEYRTAFWQAMMEPERVDGEQRQLLARGIHLRGAGGRQAQGGVGGDITEAQTMESIYAGGILVPEEWERGIHQYLQSYGGIMSTPHARMNVPHGRLIHMIFDRDIQMGGEIISPQADAPTVAAAPDWEYGLGTNPVSGVIDTIHDIPNQESGASGNYANSNLTIGQRRTQGGQGDSSGTTYRGYHVFDKSFQPFAFSTKGIEIANTFMQDEVYNFANYVRRKLTDRLFRMLSYIFTVRGGGQRYNQPLGLMRGCTTFPYANDNFLRSPLGLSSLDSTDARRTGAGTRRDANDGVGRDGTFPESDWNTDGDPEMSQQDRSKYLLVSQSHTGITMTDLLNMTHSLDPAYRNRAGVGFMFTDGTLRKLRAMTIDPQADSRDIRFIWQQNASGAAPSRILGYPYYLSTEMDEFGPNVDIGPRVDGGTLGSSGFFSATESQRGRGEFMFFGDFSEFVIRTVPGFTIRRLNELAAERDSVMFIGRGRWGSQVMIEHAVKKMVTAPAP